MREAIVAVFDTAPHTEDAVRALQAAGIDSASIRRYRKGDPAIPLQGGSTGAARREEAEPHHSSGGFWSWLTGADDNVGSMEREADYDRDYHAYSRAVEAGGTVLAVTVDDSAAPRVMDVLSAQAPMDLEIETPSGDAAARTAPAATTMQTAAPSSAAIATPAPTQRPASATTPDAAGTAARREAARPAAGREAGAEETIPLAEEELTVGKRKVDRGTTRVHRYVVERPVEEQVNLRDERVEIERRTPVDRSAPGAHAFEERTVEVRETTEEPVVSKRAGVTEEVVIRKQATEHPETVRDTVRKEEVDVERPREKR